MANHQEPAPSLAEGTYNPDIQSESAAGFVAHYQQLKDQNAQAREEVVTSTPAPAMGGIGRSSRTVLPPQAQ